MTKLIQNYEGGTSGAALTEANSGAAGNTPFTNVSAGTVTFSTTQKKDGALSALLPATNSLGIQRWEFPAEPSRNIRARWYMWFESAHAADYIIFDPRTISDPATGRTGLLLFTALSQLRLRAYGSGTQTTAWTASTAVPLGQWVRIEYLQEMGTTASNGRAKVAMFVGDSTTPIAGIDSGWVEGLNFRGNEAGGITYLNLGKVLADVKAGASYIDGVETHIGTDYAASFIGPAQVPLATPAGLTATSSTSAVSVALSWNAVAGASSYQIQPQVQSGASWTDMPVITVTGTSRTLTSADGLLPGTNYQALVRAMP